jgi:hypothetical protein
MLHHFSPIENHYDIVESGYIKAGYKTGKSALYGEGNSKWIYTSLGNTFLSNFIIHPNVLLTTKFILHTGWYSEDYKCNQIIDGTKLTKYRLTKLLEKFSEIIKLNHEMNKLIGMNTPLKNEILIKEDIDLHQYLIEYHGEDKKTKDYINNFYPKVKFI